MILAQSFRPEADFFVGWFTLALINAGLAQSKNRSGLLWWLISMVAGPVATFILVAFCDRVTPKVN